MITIAVIEDNVLTGDMISDILRGEGFRVIRTARIASTSQPAVMLIFTSFTNKASTIRPPILQ